MAETTLRIDGLSIRVKLMRVMPAAAAEWLKANKDNRKRRPGRVKRYAREMTQGLWLPSHQGIAFDAAGVLIDGQHRLAAVVESKTPQTFLVSWGWPPAGKSVLDQGLGRTDSDIAAAMLSGDWPAGVIAAAKVSNFGLSAFGKGTSVRKLARQEMLEILQRHGEALGFVFRHLLKEFKIGLGRASLAAPIVRAWYTANRDRLAAFCRVLKTGEPDDAQADRAALKLRNYLLESSGRENDTAREHTYRAAEWALAEFLAKRPAAALGRAEEELFLLPGEKAAAPAPKTEPKAVGGRPPGRQPKLPKPEDWQDVKPVSSDPKAIADAERLNRIARDIRSGKGVGSCAHMMQGD